MVVATSWSLTQSQACGERSRSIVWKQALLWMDVPCLACVYMCAGKSMQVGEGRRGQVCLEHGWWWLGLGRRATVRQWAIGRAGAISI